MKKLLVSLFFPLFPMNVFAAVETIERGVATYGTPTAVSVSTSAYTNVTPVSVRINTMSGVLIDNPSTNTGTVHGHIGNCTSTSISTSTVKGPIEIAPGNSGGDIDMDSDVCLWLVSRHTSAETITIQAVGKKR